ncbi:MAG: hypothetical protein ACRDRH_05115 [Pseudonocardia sp.]
MRLVAILVVLTLLALLVALAVLALRHRRRLRRQHTNRSAAWQDHVITRHNTTLIVVQRVAHVGGLERVLDEIVMVEVAANDPDWTSKVRTARVMAADRAFELNVQSFPGSP